MWRPCDAGISASLEDLPVQSRNNQTQMNIIYIILRYDFIIQIFAGP